VNTTILDSAYTIPEKAPELERGPLWLREKRRSFRTAFNNEPLPRRGLHLWRYTDPARFLPEADKQATATSADTYDAVAKTELKHLEQGHLDKLVIDSGGRDIKVHTAELGGDVIVCALSDAVESHHDLVEKHLYGLINSSTGKFESQNGALWNDGIFIYVPENKVVDKPIHLLRGPSGVGGTEFYRLLVVVGRGAELTLIDEYGGSIGNGDSEALTNSAVELYCEADSRVRYVSLQRQSSGASSYLTHRARISQGASMLTIPLAFGASLSKQNFGVLLDGPYCESNMYGLLFGTGNQKFDNHTLHHHSCGQSHSNIDFKVVLGNKAESAYTGLIRIDENAQVSEAYQENRNLLLNPGTKAETIPELEILNEEVSCSHGATVGPIDPMEVFYLNSRGIATDEAVRMIVSGFVSSTLRMVPEDLRDRIESFVIHRLEDI
jgi:Fe-S cluster assembly protein SufD